MVTSRPTRRPGARATHASTPPAIAWEVATRPPSCRWSRAPSRPPTPCTPPSPPDRARSRARPGGIDMSNWKTNGNSKPIDWTTNTAGIVSPNPFWLASGPPTNTADQVMRAFDAGWGGAVWKTLGEPIVNVSSRLGGHHVNGQRLTGLNNIELITDRPLDINLAEIKETKKRYPKHAVIVSLMVESKREAWHDIVKQTCDVGADGIELNFGCPHGMSERGMGAAVGQVPDYACQITEWVKEVSSIPVLVKLTPNVSDIRYVARAAAKGGADGLSLINTINSIIGVDLEH